MKVVSRASMKQLNFFPWLICRIDGALSVEIESEDIEFWDYFYRPNMVLEYELRKSVRLRGSP